MVTRGERPERLKRRHRKTESDWDGCQRLEGDNQRDGPGKQRRFKLCFADSSCSLHFAFSLCCDLCCVLLLSLLSNSSHKDLLIICDRTAFSPPICLPCASQCLSFNIFPAKLLSLFSSHFYVSRQLTLQLSPLHTVVFFLTPPFPPPPCLWLPLAINAIWLQFALLKRVFDSRYCWSAQLIKIRK